ncbi:MAG TPA: tRNA preQ1(34) S-adenosylmethionine ribosyltransferase-isomerase QueA [Candidatus Acidoferrales bacterium]|jgi:S-adenosylmethionine:tRNA ribosyltransferase-isomerase|nr:tRNA preQ1(34) S-adenosylmethionine ribosyltransferase-isomerase QueA [Candidatus Acidoferrales bacterium]
MLLSDFQFELPTDLIAQAPLPERDASRLLILDRGKQAWEDSSFRMLPDMLRGDELIVVNNARVIPARLFGRREGVRAETRGHSPRTVREFLSSTIEVLLTRQVADDEWEALVRPGRKMRVGERVDFGNGELVAEVLSRGEYGLRRIRLTTSKGSVMQAIERLGHVPLPPYIAREDETADRERYQTIFADHPGAVAAPTAGLHFSPAILEKLKQIGIEMVSVTLDVGLGTFQPIHEEDIEQHKIHSERYEIPETSAVAICKARREGRPILAVGTTVVRTLEDAAQKSALRHGENWDRINSLVEPGPSEASIFMKPGHTFRVVDQLITNFHLPQSTLLILVSAFAGRELILQAYRHAVEARYRFYSYGDCMWIK